MLNGALYWKAFAQYKLAKSDDALASLAELRRAYAESRYLGDARVLEADIRKSAGQPMTTDASDDEIKLLAISAIQNSDPDRAIPLLENVLKATNSLAVKRRALFVLAQNDKPAAHEILMSYAKGSGNPDLQIEAIRYLAARRQQTSSADLQAIYASTTDVDVRRAVLNALVNTGDAPMLFSFANGTATFGGGGSSAGAMDVQRMAISALGSRRLASPQDLMQLYQKEDNQDLRLAIVRAMASMGAVNQVVQVAKTDKDPTVRRQAVRYLSGMKPETTGTALVDLYNANTDHDMRSAIISALAGQNNASALVALARKEADGTLKVEIVRRLAGMAPRSKVASDYLMDVINK